MSPLLPKRVLAIVATAVFGAVVSSWRGLVGSVLTSSSLDFRKFLPRVLGGRPSLFGPRPSGLNFFRFFFGVFSFLS